MKRLICVLLLGLLILPSASAGAMGEYTLSPFAFDTEAMLTLAFGDQAADAQLNDRDYPFYDLPNSSGAPFCGQNDTMGFQQMKLTVYTALVSTEQYEPFIPENIEPSGVAKCALTPQQALADAEASLAELGVTDYALQSVTAYGRVSKLPGGYLLAFGQTLDGVPVYWAASTHPEETYSPAAAAQPNRIKVVVGDNGLILITGWWNAFTPTKQDAAVISEEEAIAAFADMGEDAASAELCYLLAGTQDAPVALPAYRSQNRFISAEDGAVLQ